ncbi:MAG: hypothetical protein CW338_05125 [Clostridiales bacterium]|nr:hypothetical protein [Clostridiales bacterium]
MYSREDYQKIEKQLRLRRLIVYLTGGLLLCASVTVLVLAVCDWSGSMHLDANGNEVTNRLLTHIQMYPFAFILPVLAGAVLIFGAGVFIMPVRRYRDYMKEALFGKTRSLSCMFKEYDPAAVLRDGIWVLPVLVSEGSLKDEKDDRQLYFDNRLPFPAWEEGTALQLTTHDKFIVNYKVSGEESI